jgi:hypothetical protein
MSGNTSDINYDLVDLDSLSLDELQRELDVVEHRITDISAQLDAATARLNADGVYADPMWFAKAKSAKRYAGTHHQRLLRHMAARRRQTQADPAHCFIQVARQRLDKQLFDSIMDDAISLSTVSQQQSG